MAVTLVVALKYVALLLELITDAWSFPLLSLWRMDILDGQNGTQRICGWQEVSEKGLSMTTTKRESSAPSLPDDYLVTLPNPMQLLLTVRGDPQHQGLLNVFGDGGCSVLPEHGLSPI